MKGIDRVLTKDNIQEILKSYVLKIEDIGLSVKDKHGLALLTSIKRGQVGAGPYPKVTLFEAANRVMTDLVILNGVKWLFESETFPFDSYLVEFGNEDKNDFDIIASDGCGTNLIGVAFNVAPSFFQGKKAAMLKKMRKESVKATYKLIVVNHDALPLGYTPRAELGVYYLVVNVNESSAEILPNKAEY